MNTQASLDHIESVLAGRAQWRASLDRYEATLAARGIGRRSGAPSTLAVLLAAGTVVTLVCAYWGAL
jgi:hypothetical protein